VRGLDHSLLHNVLDTILTMKFTAACTLALVASASAFAPAPTASVSEDCRASACFRVFRFNEILDPAFWMMSLVGLLESP
jgi:hypothetical protein